MLLGPRSLVPATQPGQRRAPLEAPGSSATICGQQVSSSVAQRCFMSLVQHNLALMEWITTDERQAYLLTVSPVLGWDRPILMELLLESEQTESIRSGETGFEGFVGFEGF